MKKNQRGQRNHIKVRPLAQQLTAVTGGTIYRCGAEGNTCKALTLVVGYEQEEQTVNI